MPSTHPRAEECGSWGKDPREQLPACPFPRSFQGRKERNCPPGEAGTFDDYTRLDILTSAHRWPFVTGSEQGSRGCLRLHPGKGLGKQLSLRAGLNKARTLTFPMPPPLPLVHVYQEILYSYQKEWSGHMCKNPETSSRRRASMKKRKVGRDSHACVSASTQVWRMEKWPEWSPQRMVLGGGGQTR